MAVAHTQKMKMLDGASDQGYAIVAGHWAIGATGAVGTQNRAKGFTLTRTGVGLYTLQLKSEGVNSRVPGIPFVTVELVTNDVDPTNDTDAIRAKVLTIAPSTGTVTIALTDEADVVREAANPAQLNVFAILALSGVT